MLKRTKEYLNDINQQDDSFIVYRNKANARHGRYTSMVIIVLEAFFFMTALVANMASYKPSFKYNCYMFMYGNLLFVAFIYFLKLVSYKTTKVEGAYQKNFYMWTVLFSYYCILWGVVVTFLDQGMYSNINAMVVNLIIIVPFFYIRPKESIPMFAIALAFFVLVIHRFQKSENILIGHYFNASIIYIFITLASILSYHNFKRGYMDMVALERLTVRDTLTGLFNRRGLENYIEQIDQDTTDQKIPMTIMLIDIDYFKQYNDHYGHIAGDHVLVEMGSLLREAKPSNRDCAIRFGGEEFLFITMDIEEKEALRKAEEIHRLVEGLNIEHKYSSAGDCITISSGIVHTTLGDLEWVYNEISKADSALYQAKKAGKNQFVVYNE